MFAIKARRKQNSFRSCSIRRKRQASSSVKSESNDSLEAKIKSLAGKGAHLPEDVRQFMESKFRANFSNVRIHTGRDAVEMAEQLHAEAFTYGNDIYFNNGKYNPHTSLGKR